MRSPQSRLALTFIFLCLTGVVSHAQPQETTPPPLHPWQAVMPSFSSEAYITNLRNGDKIETPFLVKFGLSGGYGLAPISKPGRAKSGHHHLLVNRPLPMDFDSALPFNEQYIHFGKGQMETVLTFEPGTYTLRMLLANQRHIPHYVYSKPVTITVTKKTDKDPKSLISKGISIGLDNPTPVAPFRVQFHASGLNVGHLAQQEKDTGHFLLTVIPADARKPVEFNFTEGQTEVWLEPPVGEYTLKLEFRDNLNPSNSLAKAVTTRLKVSKL